MATNAQIEMVPIPRFSPGTGIGSTKFMSPLPGLV